MLKLGRTLGDDREAARALGIEWPAEQLYPDFIRSLDPADEHKVRTILDLGDEVPVVPCDATDRESVKAVLLALLYSVVDQIDAVEPARA